jgi:hypothetical protein
MVRMGRRFDSGGGLHDRWRVKVGKFEGDDKVALMTVRQLSIAATVLGVVAVILFVLGRSTLGVVFILLSGLAWTLTQYGRRRSGRDDAKP